MGDEEVMAAAAGGGGGKGGGGMGGGGDGGGSDGGGGDGGGGKGGGGDGGGGDGASTASVLTTGVARLTTVALRAAVRLASGVSEERRAPEVAAVASRKSIRVPTSTDPAVTELTTASKAVGSSTRRPRRKLSGSNVSTVPAMVKSAVTTLV